jgi:hypothetical protein
MKMNSSKMNKKYKNYMREEKFTADVSKEKMINKL